MAEQSEEETIQRLIIGLRDADPNRRRSAIKALKWQQLKDERVVAALKSIVDNDPVERVRQDARRFLPGELRPRKSVQPLSRNEKIRDFLIGFLGWYLVNGGIWALLAGGIFTGFSINSGLAALNLLLFPVNLILLTVLAFARKWAALGILIALALNLFVALLLGLVFNALCAIPFFIR